MWCSRSIVTEGERFHGSIVLSALFWHSRGHWGVHGVYLNICINNTLPPQFHCLNAFITPANGSPLCQAFTSCLCPYKVMDNWPTASHKHDSVHCTLVYFILVPRMLLQSLTLFVVLATIGQLIIFAIFCWWWIARALIRDDFEAEPDGLDELPNLWHIWLIFVLWTILWTWLQIWMPHRH